jgi:hypothetical protein
LQSQAGERPDRFRGGEFGLPPRAATTVGNGRRGVYQGWQRLTQYSDRNTTHHGDTRVAVIDLCCGQSCFELRLAPRHNRLLQFERQETVNHVSRKRAPEAAIRRACKIAGSIL